MSSEYERRLQAEMDALLKGLPQRTAPPTLLPRVMAAIESRAALPWHRLSWQTWPAALRVASLASLLSLFGGLCLAGWKLPQAGAYAWTAGQLSQRFSGVCTLWNVLSVLVAAALAIVKQLPAGFIAACLVSLGLGYGLCIGLGAAWMRFAFDRRQHVDS
jgi:ABC-type amino acid transport system permease subunit